MTIISNSHAAINDLIPSDYPEISFAEFEEFMKLYKEEDKGINVHTKIERLLERKMFGC